MSRVIFFLIFAVLVNAEVILKEVKDFKDYILMAKKVDNKLFYVTENECNGDFKDFFVINGKKILICYKDAIIIKKGNKKVKIKSQFIKALKKDNIIYIATPKKLYKIDSNLKMKFRNYIFKIDDLLLYKNQLYLVSNKKFYSPEVIKKMDFSDDFPFKVKFITSGGKLFVVYKNLLKEYFKDLKNFVIKNIDDNYAIDSNEKPLFIKLIDNSLYLGYRDRIEKYVDKKLLWEIRAKNILNMFKKDSLYVVTDSKLYKIVNIIKMGNLVCKRLNGYPILIAEYKLPLVVSKGEKYVISLYDNFLNILWSKKIDAKINSAKVIDGFLYLVGSKNGKFWVAKMDLEKAKILKEKVFYKAAQGYDIAKSNKGFVAVGYKFFDFLGDYVKRFVIVLLDRDLNFITDRTYADMDAKGIKILKVGKLFFVVIKYKDGFILSLFSQKGFLTKYKLLKFDKEYMRRFYDVKLLKKIFFSTDRGVFVLSGDFNISKYKDYRYVVKILDNKFITKYGVIIGDKEKKFKDLEIVDGMFNGEFYFIGYDNGDRSVICKEEF